MNVVPIEQALCCLGCSGICFLARSPGFRDEWLVEAERICAGFGERPDGVACPGCVFAQPLGKRHVAVVQAADQANDGTGRPAELAFRLLVLPRPAYESLGGDPFAIADQFPPPWQARGELPALSLSSEPPPTRTVEQVQRVLQRPEGPNLLGGSQVLVDGGRLLFERPRPDTELLRDLWTLLPTSTRWGLWPASFAFGNDLGFDVLVVPRADMVATAGYWQEQQAGDYPEGRYELNLQVAAEAGDQRELDALFARRSRAQTWRLGLFILAASLLLVLLGSWLSPPPGPVPAAVSGPDLPPARDYPTLNDSQRQRLTAALRELADQAGIQPLPEPATAEMLLTALAERLGDSGTGRDPGAALAEGPPQRRLRVLLWKHGLSEYNDVRLSPLELVERLRQKVEAPRKAAGPPSS